MSDEPLPGQVPIAPATPQVPHLAEVVAGAARADVSAAPAASQLPAGPPSLTGQTSVSGRRQAFADVIRPLTTEDLASPGVQKMILYMLEQSEAKNEELEG